MKTMENTTIADLMVKELYNRNILATKEFAKFAPEILFKGVTAYLNSLKLKSIVTHISAPAYGKLRNVFMNVYFYHNNDEYKLKFYNVRTSKGQDVEDGFKDVDEIIYLHEDKNAIKFLNEVACLYGLSFVPTKEHTKEADNMLSTLACFIYAVESYLIATYDENGDNTVEIPGVTRVKLKVNKVNEYNEVYITNYEPLFIIKEFTELTDKVKEELNKEK